MQDTYTKHVPLRLKGINPRLWKQARTALREGDVERFFFSASSNDAMFLFTRNYSWFLQHGLAEKAFTVAWCSQKFTYKWSNTVAYFLTHLDRAKLLAAGDPLPDGETFALYRGVNRDGNPYGHSWTTSIEVARHFASWYSIDAAVYSITVPRSDVYVYIHESGRTEHEMILYLTGNETLTVVETINKVEAA